MEIIKSFRKNASDSDYIVGCNYCGCIFKCKGHEFSMKEIEDTGSKYVACPECGHICRWNPIEDTCLEAIISGTQPAVAEPAKVVVEEAKEPVASGTNVINGHEWVDLGLSVKWATCNVGAEKASDYGNYFGWGETKPKDQYTASNSKMFERGIGDVNGNPEYDAARANWGGSWRLPTKEEIKELLERCEWVKASQDGINGYKIRNRGTGNAIFIPAAGYKHGPSLYYAGESGYAWSSTPNESYTQSAYGLFFFSGYHYQYWYYRNYGFPVRPVTE